MGKDRIITATVDERLTAIAKFVVDLTLRGGAEDESCQKPVKPSKDKETKDESKGGEY